MALINNELDLSKRYLDTLDDPEFCDVKIICCDGEILANKTILSMGSGYFRCMFSNNNNFVESSSNTVKFPYTREVLNRVVLYIYTGKLNVADLALRSLLDVMELLNMMNFPSEFSTVLNYTTTNIKQGNFPLLDCLKNLDDSARMGLRTVGETLLTHLGRNFSKISQFDEVQSLSEPMIVRLLQERSEERSQTILRFRTLTLWLSLNSMDDAVKSEVLQLFNLDDFMMLQFYNFDKTMKRMEQLYNEVKTPFIFYQIRHPGTLQANLQSTIQNDDDDDLSPSADKFHLTPEAKRQYEIWFDQLQPQAGRLSEEKVKNFLGMMSEVSDSILDKIWELLDQNKDDFLDIYQFTVVYYLTWRSSYYGDEIPDKLPPQLSREYMSSY